MAVVIISNFANKSREIQMYYGIYFCIFYWLGIHITIFFSRLWININRKIMSKNWKKDLQLEFIIYYECFEKENNEQRIRAVKPVREQLVGENFYQKQPKVFVIP